MECNRAIAACEDHEVLEHLPEGEQFALLIHLRRCEPCKNVLTPEQYASAIQAVITVHE